MGNFHPTKIITETVLEKAKEKLEVCNCDCQNCKNCEKKQYKEFGKKKKKSTKKKKQVKKLENPFNI